MLPLPSCVVKLHETMIIKPTWISRRTSISTSYRLAGNLLYVFWAQSADSTRENARANLHAHEYVGDSLWIVNHHYFPAEGSGHIEDHSILVGPHFLHIGSRFPRILEEFPLTVDPTCADGASVTTSTQTQTCGQVRTAVDLEAGWFVCVNAARELARPRLRRPQ
jgi:hypothetical protein